MLDMDSLPPLDPAQRAAVNKWANDPQANQEEPQGIPDHPTLAPQLAPPTDPQHYPVEDQLSMSNQNDGQNSTMNQHEDVDNSTISAKDINMRVLREKAQYADKLARERDELARRLQEYEYAQQARQQVPIEEPEEDLNVAPDDLIEGKHLNKMGKKMRLLQEELKAYKRQTAEVTAEARLRSQYPDFDKVVTRDNLQTLNLMEPELSATLNTSQDLYSKAVSAYKLIKKLGIESQDNYIMDKERAQRNAAKPKPLASVSPQQGDSPLSKANAFANGLTPDLQKQLIKEMTDARKRM